MANLGFSTQAYDPNINFFTPIPAGDYLAMIDKADVKMNKAGTGHYIAFSYIILEGQYAERRVFDNQNISHPNQQAENIGRRAISAIGQALGNPNVQDSDQLLNQPLVIKVTIRNNKQSNEPENVIRGWASKDSYQSTAASPMGNMPPTQKTGMQQQQTPSVVHQMPPTQQVNQAPQQASMPLQASQFVQGNNPSPNQAQQQQQPPINTQQVPSNPPAGNFEQPVWNQSHATA
ncbi:DUF669 domain-containing protein [Zooshikella harenae]|uniref:DUF669 domain-containing protein n=1 Tax=Zooshikella harenae TaxID=2827238 RepID=A0ABS5ZI98_9GAMM|nr:DUF669 domain-containing protein [Zooshikella harenae]MBU2713801.1 DUF669 domain-containing protein [Zooshikella harenae]